MRDDLREQLEAYLMQPATLTRVQRETKACFDALVRGVLFWRNGVLPSYWSMAYRPGDFHGRTADALRQCLVWLDARGFQHLSARLQATYDATLKCVVDLDAKYDQHPAPADAAESDAITGDWLDYGARAMDESDVSTGVWIIPYYVKTGELVDLVEDVKRNTADVMSGEATFATNKTTEAGQGEAEPEASPPAKPQAAKSPGGKLDWLAKAMLIVQDNPRLSDAAIADKVGRNKTTLSRNTTYKLAAAIARGDKSRLPRGEKFGGDLEAFDDD